MAPRLPTFIVIGAAKAGTTALHRYLGEHPEIYMSSIKETNYFAYEGDDSLAFAAGDPMANNKFKVKTLDEYRALFADAGEEKALGESSPLYLECPSTAARIRREIPDAQILASLRDPSDRAFSAYMMQVRNARETWNVGDAFDLDVHYVRVGFYYERLKRYYDAFPREQIKVMLFDDFRRDTKALMTEIFSFLQVDPDVSPNVERQHNVGGFPKRKNLNRMLYQLSRTDSLKRFAPGWLVDMGKNLRKGNIGEKIEFPPELRARLIDHYRDDIERLQDLIGRDLGAWLAP